MSDRRQRAATTAIRAGRLPGAALCLLLAACSSPEPEIPDTPVEVLYNNARYELELGNEQQAAKLFDEVERQHPYSKWAVQAQLMAAYSYYLVDAYDDAIPALERFIELHPGNRSAPYAYYLRALCYYEQIEDVKRDQGNTEQAEKALGDVVARFPNTPYARDATLKLDLVHDHLAGKEMEVGRYYLRREQYLAAINRFKTVIDKYQTTTQVPEALLRLTEAYVALGVFDEAQRTTAVLGFNYPGSDWYQDAYNLLVSNGISLEGEDMPAPVQSTGAPPSPKPLPPPAASPPDGLPPVEAAPAPDVTGAPLPPPQ